MKELMTGNEAVARGAWEAGVHYAAAYPGTPSTEIMENISQYKEIYAEWSTNEKVALEGAVGACLAGARSLASMKHVGLNVAADPLFTFSYMGVNGGSVIVTADEPGQFSSQNEQDNRNYAKAAKLPMLEPSDSQECKDMMGIAYEISEKYNTTVLIRMTTRVCHSKSVVEVGERKEIPIKEYVKDGLAHVCVPANARKWRKTVEERMEKLEAYSEATPLNFVEYHNSTIGIITSGICYRYAKEVFGVNASYLKLGFTNPLPEKAIKDFCWKFDRIYVIEENDPYIEEKVKELGFDCFGKNTFPAYGEMLPEVIRRSLNMEPVETVDVDMSKVIMRAPTFCSGCPHRGVFYELGKHKDIMVSGDIGCYTLGYSKPYNAMDTALCMGASFSLGHGAQKVFNMGSNGKRVVTVLGDSTFFHTGINSLINTIYNNSNTVNIILDNRITGMTGHQDNPGTGFTAKGEPTNIVDIEATVKALGIKHVKVVDPNSLKEFNSALDEFLKLDEPSVIITRWPCALKKFSQADKEEFAAAYKDICQVDHDKCIGCKMCLKTGCPSLNYDRKAKKASIDKYTCLGCQVCAQVCPKKAISKGVR